MYRILRSEIINILVTEWHFTENQAVNLIKDAGVYRRFEVSRRKYHAMPKHDRFTPSLPPVSEGDFEMYGTVESARYWMSRQDLLTRAVCHTRYELSRETRVASAKRGSKIGKRSTSKARRSRRACDPDCAR